MALSVIRVKYIVTKKGFILTDCRKIIFMKKVFILFKRSIYVGENSFFGCSFYQRQPGIPAIGNHIQLQLPIIAFWQDPESPNLPEHI